MTVLERLQAFRDLIHHGNSLLGEVVTYCADAEAAVAQFAVEKEQVDQMRRELEEERSRSTQEAQSARAALVQVDAQRRELADLRAELNTAREAQGQLVRAREDAALLERRLAEARQTQRRLEDELEQTKAHVENARSLDVRLKQLEDMETKLRLVERDLADTRRALELERGRRDRAIALIKPKSIPA